MRLTDRPGGGETDTHTGHVQGHRPSIMGESYNEAAFLAGGQREDEAVGNAAQLTEKATPGGEGSSILLVSLGVPVHAALQVFVGHGPLLLHGDKHTSPFLH